MKTRTQRDRRKPKSLSRAERRLDSGLIVVFILILSIHSSFGSLGENEDQCKQRYGGTIKMEKFDAEHQTKTIIYRRLFDCNVSINFTNGVAVVVAYWGVGSMSDKNIASWLDVNSQGHRWTLDSVMGKRKSWKRDDGAAAYQEPFQDTWTQLTIYAPTPADPKIQAEPTPFIIVPKFLWRLVMVCGLAILAVFALFLGYCGFIYTITWVDSRGFNLPQGLKNLVIERNRN